MTEPTEYPIPLPVTPKMADRMRAAGWVPLAEVRARMAHIKESTRVIANDWGEFGYMCQDVDDIVSDL